MSNPRWTKTRRLLLAVALACPAAAAPPAAVAVPEALAPLGAKVGGHWAFKGTTLSFKADQPLTDAQWQAVAGLGVKLVYASGTGLDDAAVARLAGLGLAGLSVDGGPITDKVFEAAAHAPGLKSLGLSHALALKGTGAAALAGLPALESLSIGGTGFGDAGMPAVAALKGLKKLSLNHDRVTDAGLALLADHPVLESIMVSPQMTPRVGDPSLKPLSTIRTLKELTVAQTVLTYDGGLKHLKALPALERLTLTECGIDPADLAKLKADLPKVQVKFTPATDEAVAKWRAQAAKGK